MARIKPGGSLSERQRTRPDRNGRCRLWPAAAAPLSFPKEPVPGKTLVAGINGMVMIKVEKSNRAAPWPGLAAHSSGYSSDPCTQMND